MGQAALLTGRRTGPTPRLSPLQITHSEAELNRGASYHGFWGDIWTRERVNDLIHRLFGVSYHPTQVGRLLRKQGWSRQKPQRKARQQDPIAVQQWREQRLPALKKS